MSLDPFFHCPDLAAEFLPAGLYPATEKPLLSIHSAIKRETRKVKCIRLSFPSCFSVLPGKPSEFQYLCLFLRQFQSIFPEPFFQSLPEYLCFIFVLETTDKIITIPDQIAFAFALSLYDYVKPVIVPRSLSRNLPFSMIPAFRNFSIISRNLLSAMSCDSIFISHPWSTLSKNPLISASTT